MAPRMNTFPQPHVTNTREPVRKGARKRFITGHPKLQVYALTRMIAGLIANSKKKPRFYGGAPNTGCHELTCSLATPCNYPRVSQRLSR
jgi:hypothetical protein